MSCRLSNMKAQRIAAGYVGDTGLTQLAARAHVHVGTIRQLEDGGNVDDHVAQRIADTLGVSLATLGQAKL